jgi:hypothetical protein
LILVTAIGIFFDDVRANIKDLHLNVAMHTCCSSTLSVASSFVLSILAGDLLVSWSTWQRDLQVGGVLQCGDFAVRAGRHICHVHLPQEPTRLAETAGRFRAHEFWQTIGHADFIIGRNSERHPADHYGDGQYPEWLDNGMEGCQKDQQSCTIRHFYKDSTGQDFEDRIQP